jgi:hypothetical protein
MPKKRDDMGESAADREISFTRVTSAWVLVLIILFGITTPATENRSIRFSIGTSLETNLGTSLGTSLGGGDASTPSEGECAEGAERIHTSQAMAHDLNAPSRMVWVDPKQVTLQWPKGFTATIERGRSAAQFEMMATFAEEGRKRLTMRMVFGLAEARDQNVREFGSIENGKPDTEEAGRASVCRFFSETLFS